MWGVWFHIYTEVIEVISAKESNDVIIMCEFHFRDGGKMVKAPIAITTTTSAEKYIIILVCYTMMDSIYLYILYIEGLKYEASDAMPETRVSIECKQRDQYDSRFS